MSHLPSNRNRRLGVSSLERSGLSEARSARFHPLEFLARHFDVVEINSSFYQPLKPEVVKALDEEGAGESALPVHRQAAPALHARAGAGRRRSRRVQGRAAAAAERQPQTGRGADAVPVVVPVHGGEPRVPHPAAAGVSRVSAGRRDAAQQLDGGGSIGTFLDYRVGFCNIDQPEYTRAMPPTAFLTSGVGYVRLHGRNPKNSLGAYERGAPADASTIIFIRRRNWPNGPSGSSTSGATPNRRS